MRKRTFNPKKLKKNIATFLTIVFGMTALATAGGVESLGGFLQVAGCAAIAIISGHIAK